MYLVYVGESGDTGTSLKDPNQPHHVCTGLMIPEDQWNGIKEEFSIISRGYFGRTLGEPDTPTELHAGDILQGKGFFSSWPKARRLQLIDDLLNILIWRETPLIVSYVDKREFASAREQGSDLQHCWRSPWEATFSRFAFSLDLVLDEVNMGQMSADELSKGQPMIVRERAAIIADGAKHADQGYMQESLKTELDMPTGALLEVMHFVRSENSHCTQLADMCAYFVRRNLQQPSRLNPQYEALKEGRVIQVVYPVQM